MGPELMTSALDLKFADLAREIQRLKSLRHECSWEMT